MPAPMNRRTVILTTAAWGGVGAMPAQALWPVVGFFARLGISAVARQSAGRFLARSAARALIRPLAKRSLRRVTRTEGDKARNSMAREGFTRVVNELGGELITDIATNVILPDSMATSPGTKPVKKPGTTTATTTGITTGTTTGPTAPILSRPDLAPGLVPGLVPETLAIHAETPDNDGIHGHAQCLALVTPPVMAPAMAPAVTPAVTPAPAARPDRARNGVVMIESPEIISLDLLQQGARQQFGIAGPDLARLSYPIAIRDKGHYTYAAGHRSPTRLLSAEGIILLESHVSGDRGFVHTEFRPHRNSRFPRLDYEIEVL